ncbi:hypothetical protein KHQ81_08005 [Mycoplasmatota bacterium]|nr:hypothetical protein KHQ81_08005 [Mycoplasmatota bacterium]
MYKKLSLFIVSSLTLICFYKQPAIANILKKEPKIYNTDIPKLTDEQKELLKEKKDTLKKKYLENWKDKSPTEKQKALQQYKQELDQFCMEHFGLSYRDLKTKYHQYFKRYLT